MTDRARQTVDHDEIRQWVERRGGRPAFVGRSRKVPGLRIDFPQYRIKAALRRITWDEFFNTFEAGGCAFVYGEETEPGQLSRFYRFIKRVS